VLDPGTGALLAGARGADGRSLLNTAGVLRQGRLPLMQGPGAATTIGVVATDAHLTKSQVQKMAQTAHDGLARAISPLHTQWDGDTVFALATSRTPTTLNAAVFSMLAAEVMALAVVNAIKHASRVSGPGVPDLPTWRELA
jgi:L-aminopeptidase/D-esterase-like protein